MSDTTPAVQNSTAPAVPAGYEPIEGLEDFDQSDIVMPQLQIDGDTTSYVDSLSKEQFSELEVVILGLVKGRVLWPAEVGEDKVGPMCQSYDHEVGLVDAEKPERFPWAASGFDRKDFEHGDGIIAPLPCEGCALKEFGTHPTRSNTPWCSEQYKLVVLMKVGDEFAAPAVLMLQRSGLKSTKAYMSSFQRARTPLFVAVTRLSLTGMTRGKVNYAVPNFTRVRDTDTALHPEWTAQYRMIRDALKTPRSRDVEEEPVAAASQQSAAAHASDDEIPF